MKTDQYKTLLEIIKQQRSKNLMFDPNGHKQELIMHLEELASILEERLFSEAFANRYYKSIPLNQATVEDYYIKVVDSSHDHYLLSSLRFKGLDPEYPFIFIDESASEIHYNNAARIMSDIAGCYPKLSLRSIAFYSRLDFSTWSLAECKVDKILVGGVINDLITADVDFNDSVKLEPCTFLSEQDYQRYEQEYKILVDSNNKLRKQLRIEKHDYLQGLASNNFLWKITINNEFAGFIAVDWSIVHRVFGLEIIEEILFSTYRGAGYGHIAQHLLINELYQRGMSSCCLFGSIYAENYAALKTAVKNKRIALYYLNEYLINNQSNI
jgi:hypothetical protein